MSRYYNGDIEGKLWSGSMLSNVADCYGKGEFFYESEELEIEVSESEKLEMSDEERKKVSDVPYAIDYVFTDKEAILKTLKSKAEEAQKLYDENFDLCNSALEENGLSHKDNFFASLVENAENGELDPSSDYFEVDLPSALHTMQYEIHKKDDSEIQVFGEVYIGLQILMCLQKQDECFFQCEL